MTRTEDAGGEGIKESITIAHCADNLGPRTGPRARKAAGKHEVDRIITRSFTMKRIMSAVAKIAPTRSAVLLRGEPGTGKDIIARAIHGQSQNRAGPFIKVCCDYLNNEELMRELFGFDSGFLPNAAQPPAQYPGDISLAAGGTLFISEVGHFSLSLQKRLLRLLQEQVYKPLGSPHTFASNVRIICATEKNLEQMMVQGEFLAELYYRIHIATINLPSLRDRKEDIPGLVDYFFERYNRLNGLHLSMAEAALAPLYLCHWPGNVRDLENCLEHAALQAAGNAIPQLPCLSGRCYRQHLNQKINQPPDAGPSRPGAGATAVQAAPLWQPGACNALPMAKSASYADDEDIRYRLVAALEKSGGVKAKAARLLNITPRQLYYALKKWHIEVKKF